MDIAALLDTFKNKRILVIGDTIVDVRTECTVKGVSAETPTMVLRKTMACPPRLNSYDQVSLGGAALVARNLLALGAQVDFLTFDAGDGAYHQELERWTDLRLAKHLIKPQVSLGKPTTIKHRYWAGGYQMLQVNTENDNFIDPKTEARTRDAFCVCMYNNPDAIVIADYRQGFITVRLASVFAVNPMGVSVPMYVSSQTGRRESNHHWYSDAAFKVMNQDEYNGLKTVGPPQPKVITRGALGSVLTPRDQEGGVLCVNCPAIKVESVDTCGAGDAFLAAFALTEDQVFANTWAGLSTTVKGPNPPTTDMLTKWSAQNDCG